MHIRTLAIAATLVVSAATAPTVLARGENIVNAPAVCQPALPAFEGVFRKRPMALQNEGASSGFVSCSLVSPSYYGGNLGTRGAEVTLANNTALPKQVDCSFVIGEPAMAPLYVTRNVTLAANARAGVWFESEDIGDGNPVPAANTINISCNVPTGVGLTKTYVWWDS